MSLAYIYKQTTGHLQRKEIKNNFLPNMAIYLSCVLELQGFFCFLKKISLSSVKTPTKNNDQNKK